MRFLAYLDLCNVLFLLPSLSDLYMVSPNFLRLSIGTCEIFVLNVAIEGLNGRRYIQQVRP